MAIQQTKVDKNTYCVLIIDNKVNDIYSLMELIKRDDMFEDCAHTKMFWEADNLIEEHNFNIIICDYNMPQEGNITSGLEYLITLRQNNPDMILCLNSGFYKSAKNIEAQKKMEKFNIFENSKTQANPYQILLRKLKQKINEIAIPLTDDTDQFDVDTIELKAPSRATPIRDTEKMVLQATISHLDREQEILELRITNPDNEQEYAYKTFPKSLFSHLDKLKINQIINIVKTVSKGGAITIKFESTGEIEPPPKTASKWDDEIRGVFDEI